MERNENHPSIRKLDSQEALDFMLEKDFCNPHQLVRDELKLKIRKEFFQELFTDVYVYLLNTVETPEESLERIKHLLN